MEHKLINGTLYREDRGIIGRCVCGWTTGYRFSSFAASAAMMDHQEHPERKGPPDHDSIDMPRG